MDNFLRSPVLPGVNTEKHEHRRLVIVLAVVLAIAVAICMLLLLKNDKVQPNLIIDSPREETVIEQLNKSAIQLSEQEKIDIATDLSFSAIELTDEEKSRIAAELLEN